MVIGGKSEIGIPRFIELLMRSLELHILCEELKVSNPIRIHKVSDDVL